MISPKLFLLLQLAAYWPAWSWYAARLSDGSDEPWGIAALVTAGIFVVREADWRKPLGRKAVALPLVLLATYTVLYSQLPWLLKAALATASSACAGCALLPSGRVRVSLLGLFLLGLPLIASLQFYLGFPVRLLTTVIAANIISWVTPVEASGTNLLWLGEIVSIDAPCAGIRMLWAGMYLNFSFACFGRLPNAWTWLSYVLASLTIFAANLGRTVALFFTESRIIAAPDWAHSTIGVLAFLIAAVVILHTHLVIQRKLTCASLFPSA